MCFAERSGFGLNALLGAQPRLAKCRLADTACLRIEERDIRLRKCSAVWAAIGSGTEEHKGRGSNHKTKWKEPLLRIECTQQRANQKQARNGNPEPEPLATRPLKLLLELLRIWHKRLTPELSRAAKRRRLE